MFDLTIAPSVTVPLTSMFVGVISWMIITGFAVESLRTGQVWGANRTFTRSREPRSFWLHIALYGSTLALAAFVLGTALHQLVQ